MSREEILALVNYRLEQAQTAIEDGNCLLEGGRSPQGIVNRAYYAMFYAALALLQKIGKVPSNATRLQGISPSVHQLFSSRLPQ